MSTSTPFTVKVHPFESKTPGSCGFEYGNQNAPNALVSIGGLTGGPHTSAAAKYIAERLQSTDSSYSLWEFRMRSSYSGFGFSSLSNDAEDIGAFVTYLRGLGKKKIVLVGHSTGCQDCLEYTNHRQYDNPPVDGYVLLAPVSDRESASRYMPMEAYDGILSVAQKMIAEGKGQDAMPLDVIPPIFASPVTAYRWNSIAAKGGDDDYFSSDLDDKTLAGTFGRIDKPVLILPSEKDESVPDSVDKTALMGRWMGACQEGIASAESSLNPGANHTLSEESAQAWAADKIVSFLQSLEGQC